MKTAITAHSGCENTPDNSMESIMAGISSGAESVEVDVRIDGNGELVLTHDTCADCAGLVRLKDAFDIVLRADVSINCDLKEYRALYPTIALAGECGLPREKFIFSGSVDASLLETDPSIARRARIFLNTEELCRHLARPVPKDRAGETRFIAEHPDAVAAFVHKTGVEAINAPFEHIPHELIAALHSRDVALSLWTANTSADIERLLGEGIFSLTTRRPKEAVRIRGGAK